MNTGNRISHFDIARFLCMIWIVGIWHGRSYIHDFPLALQHPFWEDLTTGILAYFVFTSGYFNGKKIICNRNDIIRFYKRRIRFLYIPFLASATLMLIMRYVCRADYIVNFRQFALSLLGLSLVFPPAPSTIWFVVLLIPYYAITPIILKSKNKYIICIITYSMFIAFQKLMSLIGTEIDSRLIFYYPIYCVGLCWPNEVDGKFQFKKYLLFIVITMLLEIINIHIDSLYKYILIFFLCGVVLETGKLIVIIPHIAGYGGGYLARSV